MTLTAQSLAGMVVCSRELLQDSVNIDAALAQAFAKRLAVVLDAACLVGSGTPPEPRGIHNTSGIASVSMGTNGAAITSYSPLLDLRRDLETANAEPPSAWIVAPRTARTLAGLVDSSGQPLMMPSWLTCQGVFWAVAPNDYLADIPGPRPLWMSTPGVPVNQVQGSASNASSIYAGDFRAMLIGIREDFRFEINPQLYAATGGIAIVCHMRADVTLTTPASFGRIVGVIP